MRIALYKNPGAIGWLISWHTWSDYTHGGHVLDDDSVIEARMSGVRHISHPLAYCGRRCVADVFEVEGLSDDQKKHIEDRARLRVEQEQKYDLWGLLGFVLRVDLGHKKRAFCTELVFEDYLAAGVKLLSRIKAFKVSPGRLATSPKLKYVGTWKWGENGPVWSYEGNRE